MRWPPPLLPLVLLAASCGCAPPRDGRPNIVLILLDDMGYSDLGSYGSEIPTPHIDALAASGLRFTGFYNTGKCYPTRASLLTGMYAQRALDGRSLSDDAVTIAEALGAAGYATFMSGKWHLDGGRSDEPALHPLARGFDRFYGTIIGGSYFNPLGLQRDRIPVTPEADYYYTDAIAEEAERQIAAGARARVPFFLYVAFTAPHWPLQAPGRTIARHEGAYGAGWDAIRAARYRRQLELGVVSPRWGVSRRDPSVPAWEEVSDRAWQARRMAVYAAMVEHADRGVGRIARALDGEGMLDDTLILLLSDNGASDEGIPPGVAVYTLGGRAEARDGRPVQIGSDPATPPGPETTYQSYEREWANVSNTPFRRYKHWSHEGGIATPLIAHWPAAIGARGAITSAVAHVIDIFPTCLDAAGVEMPGPIRDGAATALDGTSLLPVFAGGPIEPRALFWEYGGTGAARVGRWKIVTGALARQEWELYDMEADRCELNDLAGLYPGRATALAERHRAWAARVGARID